MCQCLFVTSNVIGETITDKVNINELYLIDGTAIRDWYCYWYIYPFHEKTILFLNVNILYFYPL